ncbi:MAG TPA: amidohydrolase [Elusimicrobia bacterium]|nr:amidohydrolase [Elusimicrobiota bacterium]
MKVSICQFDPVFEDKEANKKKVSALLDSAKELGDWVVFHEMTLTGFTASCAAATLSAADHAYFAELARSRKIWLSYGGAQDGFNKLFTLDRSGRLVSEYSKIHLYSFGNEHKEFKAGCKQTTFPLEGLAVTPMVCFDLRFPYLFWHLAPKTDLYVVIAGWPMRRAEHWMTLLRARAVENQAYVIGVNRIGKEPSGLEYSGNSMVFDPLGKVALDCRSEEGVFTAELKKELVDTTRKRFPFFNDRLKEPAFA